jgi:uncharacterized hydrophobic protein (TIGR00271 family)
VIHVRLVCPPGLTDELVGELVEEHAVRSVIVLRDAARTPPGDAVQFDVRHAGANAVIRRLRDRGLDRDGAVTLESVDVELRDPEAQPTREERKETTFRRAPIWAELRSRMEADAPFLTSWFVLLTAAAIIAAVGILLNSQILIVGAMVVGPEYSAMSAAALGLTRPRDLGEVARSLRALVVGLGLAIAATAVFTGFVRAFDRAPRAYELGIRPVSQLIDAPNVYSVVVAVLAAIVGVVSLTQSRTGTLVGVFISVTTIPAAADVAVAAVFGSWDESLGSLVQLVLNVTILTVVGAATVSAMRWFWTRRGNGP